MKYTELKFSLLDVNQYSSTWFSKRSPQFHSKLSPPGLISSSYVHWHYLHHQGFSGKRSSCRFFWLFLVWSGYLGSLLSSCRLVPSLQHCAVHISELSPESCLSRNRACASALCRSRLLALPGSCLPRSRACDLLAYACFCCFGSHTFQVPLE